MPKESSVQQKCFFGLPKMLLTVDMFGSPLPGFNAGGDESVRTHSGGCLSLIIMYITFLFATLKLQHLMMKHNPSVNVFVDQEAFDETDVWYAEEQDFIMAFSVVDYGTGQAKNDLRFVKWVIDFYTGEEGEHNVFEVPMYECTEEDFAKFYEPSVTSVDKIERYKKSKDWMCVDWSTIYLQGRDSGANYRTMDVMLTPCNFKPDINASDAENRIPEDCNWDKDKLIEYIGPSQMLLYYNVGRFQLDEFGERRIKKSSVVKPIQFDEYRPTWISNSITSNELADETGIIQYGIQEENEFTTVMFEPPRPSALSGWPTKEKPDGRYKVVSAYLTLNLDQHLIERQTYSLLEWLGDVGGLFDMLGLMGGLVIAPISAFALKSLLLTQTFRYTKSLTFAEQRARRRQQSLSENEIPPLSELQGEDKVAAHMQWDFKHAKRIGSRNFILTTFGCNRHTKYKKMLNKAESSISKELDIVKFLQRSRLTSYTAIATLNGRQQYIADKMATMLIRESTDFDDGTEDDAELDQENIEDTTNHGKKIFISHNEVDRRLLRVYQAQRWKEDQKRHQGKGGPFAELECEKEIVLKKYKNKKVAPFSVGLDYASPTDCEASGRQLVPPIDVSVPARRTTTTPRSKRAASLSGRANSKMKEQRSKSRPPTKRSRQTEHVSSRYRDYCNDSSEDGESPVGQTRLSRSRDRPRNFMQSLNETELTRQPRHTSHHRRAKGFTDDENRSTGRRISRYRK